MKRGLLSFAGSYYLFEPFLYETFGCKSNVDSYKKEQNKCIEMKQNVPVAV